MGYSAVNKIRRFCLIIFNFKELIPHFRQPDFFGDCRKKLLEIIVGLF